jgi:2,4-dienoyl-CoA reductase-like NADH-dependent reductase (Old Yellow Enzyme family)
MVRQRASASTPGDYYRRRAEGGVGLIITESCAVEDFFGKEAHSTGAAGFQELLRRFKNDEFDFVSVGCGRIGDPDWVNKVGAGRYSDIRMFTKKDVVGDLEVEGFVEEAHRG